MNEINLLICTAGPEPAKKNVKEIVKVVKFFEARSTVLNVLPHRSTIPNKELKNRGEKATSIFKEAIEKEGYEADIELKFSEDIVDGIIKTSKEIDADLIVMGVGKKPHWYQFTKKNVNEEIIHRANCPVLSLPKDIKNSPFA